MPWNQVHLVLGHCEHGRLSIHAGNKVRRDGLVHQVCHVSAGVTAAGKRDLYAYRLCCMASNEFVTVPYQEYVNPTPEGVTCMQCIAVGEHPENR